jgi:hypothetical protein
MAKKNSFKSVDKEGQRERDRKKENGLHLFLFHHLLCMYREKMEKKFIFVLIAAHSKKMTKRGETRDITNGLG